MQVDNPLRSPSAFAQQQAPQLSTLYGPSFDDFFNLDLPSAFASTTHNNATSSSSASSSPRSMPQTPPQGNVVDAFGASGNDSFFNMYLEDEYATKSNAVPPALSSAPYDFLGYGGGGDLFGGVDIMSGGGGGSSSSPTSSNSNSNATATATIDPSLVDSPSTDFADDEGSVREQEHEEDEVAPVKVGGKGSQRRGTVHSGRIEKKQSPPQDRDEDDDDWRPSPEEYKKMSSKEKRQLRNKISARNFRVRRKEYIQTLEGDVAERDRLLSAIRSELGSTQSENAALRQEIAILKKTLMSGRAPSLPPPGPLPSSTPVPASPTPAPAKINTQKDLPSSPRMGKQQAFWGGGFAGGMTPVHTTLVPDMGLGLGTWKRGLQENINPALNAPSPNPKAHEKTQAGFDGFTDLNPFTLKTLDAYRMQLWGKMAQQQQQQAAAQHKAGAAGLQGLAGSMRPQYFASPKNHAAYAQQVPPPISSKPFAASSSVATNAGQKERDAMYAALASQTLVKRLGGAFWDAFAGQKTAAGASGSAMDPEKVRKVLEGRAVVRVVDLDSPLASPKPAPANVPIKTAPVSPKLSASVPEAPHRKSSKCSVSELLEESMRSLSLGKK